MKMQSRRTQSQEFSKSNTSAHTLAAVSRKCWKDQTRYTLYLKLYKLNPSFREYTGDSEWDFISLLPPPAKVETKFKRLTKQTTTKNNTDNSSNNNSEQHTRCSHIQVILITTLVCTYVLIYTDHFSLSDSQFLSLCLRPFFSLSVCPSLSPPPPPPHTHTHTLSLSLSLCLSLSMDVTVRSCCGLFLCLYLCVPEFLTVCRCYQVPVPPSVAWPTIGDRPGLANSAPLSLGTCTEKVYRSLSVVSGLHARSDTLCAALLTTHLWHCARGQTVTRLSQRVNQQPETLHCVSYHFM